MMAGVVNAAAVTAFLESNETDRIEMNGPTGGGDDDDDEDNNTHIHKF